MTHSDKVSPYAVVVDWGTTTLRASLVTAKGAVIADIETEKGIQFISDGNFESELLSSIGHWGEAHGPLPIIALGMITSRNGWVEVPYVSCPATVADLAAGVLSTKLSNGSDLIFLAGITDTSRMPYPDVMRGEETQIVGSGLATDSVCVLPGTHSKWARIEGGKIKEFQTFVTGELFALLSKHSFIANAITEDSSKVDWAAFDHGVGIAKSLSGGDAAFLTQLFSARTGMLAKQLQPAHMKDYVSGLLIGNEFRQASESGWFRDSDKIGIVGNDGLNSRYERAAATFNLKTTDRNEKAAIAGALRIFAAMGDCSETKLTYSE